MTINFTISFYILVAIVCGILIGLSLTNKEAANEAMRNLSASFGWLLSIFFQIGICVVGFAALWYLATRLHLIR